MPPPPIILDSGTTGHFLLPTSPCINLQPNPNGIRVRLPDGRDIVSTHTCTIPGLDLLPAPAQQGHIFPKLANHALLSVGVFTDHGCVVQFDKDIATVKYNDTSVLTAHRNSSGLWAVTDTSPASASAPPPTCNIVTPTSTVAELVTYLHACLFSPTKSTLLRAIRNGNLSSWPSLTITNVARHLQEPIATDMGHLDQQRKNLQSTKTAIHNAALVDCPITDGRNTHDIFADLVNVPTKTGQIATDQTGAFPHYSFSGNRYIMVLYDFDSNAILAEPLINKTAAEHLRAYKKLHALLVSRGLRPQLQRLDNEASTILKAYIKQEQIDYQLAPPGIHRRNAAERAIRTFKNHFVAGLSSTDPHFPIFLWDQLIDQATITLNLLRQSRINPRLSAYAQLHGTFDFNRTPLAPPGTKVVKHLKTTNRASWATHGVTTWYVGPAMEHYRCYRLFDPRTQAYSIADTVSFHPHHVAMPRLSSADATRLAAKELIHALQHPHPATPFAPLGDPDNHALTQLAAIFDRTFPGHPAGTPVAAAPGVAKANTKAPRHQPAPARPTPHTEFAQLAAQQPRFAIKTHTWTSSMGQACAALIAPSASAVDNILQSPALLSPTEFAHSVIDPITGQSLEYRQLIVNPRTQAVWQRSAANEFGRLAQGVGGRIQGTDTIDFIYRHEVPSNKTPTYARFVCSERPQKAEVERVRLTVGGNLIEYPHSTSTPTSDITSFKCLVNSVLSDPTSKMVCADIKNFYLNTPMDSPEFMRIHKSLIPPEIMTEYDLEPKIANDYIYVRINKGMYGLPQAGKLANLLLEKRLKAYGYFQCRHTPGLWKHISKKLLFTLVVDDLAIKYSTLSDANHLLDILRKNYEAITVDWGATLYCGITLKWDYANRTCDLSMPGYVAAALAKYEHPPPTRKQYAPHRFNVPQYGQRIQSPEPLDETDPLDLAGTKRIQKITGTLLFYARAVDNTLLVALSDIASRQAKATSLTAQDSKRILDYCATNPDATLRFTASDMLLKGHSDASYLNASKARSRIGGHFYLGNRDPKPDPVPPNGAILNPVGILRHVASSAAEAECGGLFVNLKEALVLRQTLLDMDHPQPTTPIQTDNSTAAGIANDTIKQNKTRHIDMRYHWIRDRVAQGQFNVFWKPGSTNLADYFTKHHAPIHHRHMRPTFLHR